MESLYRRHRFPPEIISHAERPVRAWAPAATFDVKIQRKKMLRSVCAGLYYTRAGTKNGNPSHSRYDPLLIGGKEMINLLVGVLSFTIAAGCVLGQSSGTQNEPKIQTLIITGQNGHDWRGTTPLLRKILEDTGRFEVRVTEEFRGAGPDTLAPYDLVVLNYFERRRPELWWGKRAQEALLGFVRSGKGLVVYHFSIAAFNGWDGYEKLCAANWRPNNGHHSPRHDFTVEIKDRDHPITRGLKASFPVKNDELYANLKWQPKDTYSVVATAWDDHSSYKNRRQPTPGPGLHQPMMWTLPYDLGRVFVTVLGHASENLESIGFQVTYARGAEWAATGEVTLAIPATMAE